MVGKLLELMDSQKEILAPLAALTKEGGPLHDEFTKWSESHGYSQTQETEWTQEQESPSMDDAGKRSLDGSSTVKR